MAAPAPAAWSSVASMALSGASPRAVRSRLVTTNNCSAGVKLDQSEGRIIGPRPSCCRALSMAARLAWVHDDDSSTAAPLQISRKFGSGAIFEVGLLGETLVWGAAGAAGAVGAAEGRGLATGAAGLGGGTALAGVETDSADAVERGAAGFDGGFEP